MIRFSRKNLGIPYAIFLLLFVILPLLIILYYAFTEKGTGHFTFGNFVSFFSSTDNLTTLFVSFALAILTTICCLLIAYPTAYLLAMSNMNKKGILLLLFIMPMWINFVLRTAAMKELLYLLHMFDSNKTSFINTLIGMVYDYLPFMILPLYTVLCKMDKSLIEASSDLGATPATTFLKVTLPLTVPGIISGITMVLLPTTTSYVISDTLGNGNITIIGKLIETQFSSAFNWNAGSAIAVVLLLLIFIMMLCTNKFNDIETNVRGNNLW